MSNPSAGNESASDAIVEAAYREHAASIHGVTARSTGDSELAGDITQEAFIRLLIEVRAGRCPDNIRAWLYTASANLVVTRARREAVARRFSATLAPMTGPAQPEEIAVHREAQDEVRESLATLASVDRAALLMSAHGTPGAEIASRLGYTPVAARARLYRAREVLRARRARSEAGAARTPARHAAPRFVRAAGAA